MKYGLFLIPLLFLFSIQAERNSFERLMALQGVWARENGKGILYESWQKGPGNNQLYGVSYTLSGKDTLLVEKMSLHRNEKEIVFSAIDMQGKEKTPTAFSLTRINNRSFFFENPSHDYPKRIVYELISKDSLHAWIDGGENVKDSRVDFYFRRMQ